MTRICLAGATGWVGRALAPAIHQAPDLELASAYTRTHQKKKLNQISEELPAVPISSSIKEALGNKIDVLVDFTAPEAVKKHVHAALLAGIHVVIGTSGLNDAEYEEIEAVARKHNVGVVAAGNFALTGALMMKFAREAAVYVPNWEILDYSDHEKKDAPSGTARELAHVLSSVSSISPAQPVAEAYGYPEARGVDLEGTRVHSVRVPGFVLAAEVIFGKDSERLSIRYDAGTSAEPYVAGTLLAIRKVTSLVGLTRGMDKLL